MIAWCLRARQSGRIRRLAEGSCVSQSGSTGADWRMHNVFDRGRGGFAHVELSDAHGAEALRRQVALAFRRVKSLPPIDRRKNL